LLGYLGYLNVAGVGHEGLQLPADVAGQLLQVEEVHL
jgi:hypothetical protein